MSFEAFMPLLHILWALGFVFAFNNKLPFSGFGMLLQLTHIIFRLTLLYFTQLGLGNSFFPDDIGDFKNLRIKGSLSGMIPQYFSK